jgi:hypothetical protein
LTATFFHALRARKVLGYADIFLRSQDLCRELLRNRMRPVANFSQVAMITVGSRAAQNRKTVRLKTLFRKKA